MRKLALVALALVPLVAVADTPIAYRLGKGAQLTPYPSCHTAVLKASNNGMLCVDSSASNVLKYKNPAGATITLGAAGAGTGYATILDEGSTLTQQTSVNFIGAGISCVDNGGASRTDCTISSGGSTGNWTFTGDAADDSGAAVLTIGATTATGVTIGRTAGANILAADTTLASGKTLTGAAASDLYLNAVTGQLVRLRVNGSNMLSVSSTAATLAVPLVMTGTQTGTYTLGGTPTITAPVISGGLTASGSAANDFSASTGTFLTSTGIVTLGGSQIKLTNGDLDPQNDNVIDLGDSTHKYRQVWGASLFASSVDPLTDSTDDIGDGAATKFWRVAYVNDISFKGSTGPFTIGAYGGTNYLSILSASCSTGASSCSRIVGSQGSHTTLEVAPDTATTLTASTEHIDVLLDMNRAGNDVQFSTGALATQRSVLVKRPRYAFVGASTITNAATLAIDAAPEASTNATITNSYALWVQAGRIAADGGLKLTGDLTGVYNIAGTPTATSPILANLGATTVAPTWTAITYSNSWVDYGASSTSRYSKNATGQVTLEIRCKNGSTATAAINSGTPIAAGYRPSQVTQICGQTLAGGIACGDLDTGGVFTPSVSSTSGIFLRAQYFAEN